MFLNQGDQRNLSPCIMNWSIFFFSAAFYLFQFFKFLSFLQMKYLRASSSGIIALELSVSISRLFLIHLLPILYSMLSSYILLLLHLKRLGLGGTWLLFWFISQYFYSIAMCMHFIVVELFSSLSPSLYSTS